MTRAKIKTTATALALPLALGGCDLIFPKDRRIGEERVEACINRLNADIDMFDFRELSGNEGSFVPTYTFDITKLPFEAKQKLIQPGADETLGSRLMSQTNEASTAMAAFMQASVDEKGAFFFGVEPALWRVRGKPLPHADILKAGCEKQGADMRLLHVDVSQYSPAPEPDTDPETSETRP
ncbi:MAG: hypothetical protein WBA51_04765 [Erythrobacter sp.]